MLGWKNIGFESYKDYLNHWMWQQKREQILGEIDFCNVCKCKGGNLEIHHTKEGYNRIPQERMRDLIVVCRECHEKIHKDEKDAKQKNKRGV